MSELKKRYKELLAKACEDYYPSFSQELRQALVGRQVEGMEENFINPNELFEIDPGFIRLKNKGEETNDN